MNTNGQEFNEEMAKFLSGHNVKVILSLDSIKDVNDLERINLDGKSYFEKAVKTIRLLMFDPTLTQPVSSYSNPASHRLLIYLISSPLFYASRANFILGSKLFLYDELFFIFISITCAQEIRRS